jgi:hypothetical protein
VSSAKRDTRALASSAMRTRSAELRCGGCAPSSAALSGALRPIMSALSTAAIAPRGTVGRAAYQREPSSPRSSAPCHTNSAERRPGRAHERAADGEQRRAHRGVVVGAVPHRVDHAAPAVVAHAHRVAHAVVVVVAAEEHVLAAQRRVAPGRAGDHVGRSIGSAGCCACADTSSKGTKNRAGRILERMRLLGKAHYRTAPPNVGSGQPARAALARLLMRSNRPARNSA